MKTNSKFFNNHKSLPVDKFFHNVLYDKKIGYYNSRLPFGRKGDFITAPGVSNLFSEMIAIWFISTWEVYGKPENFSIVELGPGDGSLMRTLIQVFKKFPEFNKKKKIYLFEISNFMKKLQKKNIGDKSIKWVKNFNEIKKGPVIFFGNEFFDSIPIKQFKREKKLLFEKYYVLKKDFNIMEAYKKASIEDEKQINSYKTLRNINFIEYPKSGLREMKKIIKKISNLEGCLLMIDYGYLNSNNQNTLQSVIKHKKNSILSNLGKADVTSHVNFSLLNEFFLKNGLTVHKIISQRQFLENMGIKERSEIIAKRMKFSEKSNLYLRLNRILNPKLMGDLFKVIVASNSKKNEYFGFAS
jgi:cyclopropane-fatty-acyl-phospholipid synthase